MFNKFLDKKKKHYLIMIPLIAFVFNGCEEERSSKEVVKTLRSVKYITVSESEAGRSHTYFGTSQAQHEAKLSFRVSGIIQDISVKVGDTLKRGDSIAKLEKVSFELEVDKQQASLAQMEADRRKSESDYKRTKELYENNNVSIEELESSRTSVESARAQVSFSKKTLKQKELDLLYTELKSSENCSVSEVYKEMNENVNAGEDIVSVACGEVNEIKISVPENLINSIKNGMLAKVKFDSISNREFNAKVSEVSVSSSSSTTFPIILTLNNLYEKNIRSGMAAEVTFTLYSGEDEEHSILYLPPIAVGKDVDGRYVYIVKPTNSIEEGLIKRQSVHIGALTSSGIEIFEGITSGDKIVTAGMSTIRDGLIVKAE